MNDNKLNHLDKNNNSFFKEGFQRHSKSKLYQQSGVNLEAGYESVRCIKKHVERTHRLGMMGDIGTFGGMFDLSLLQMKEPILVSGTDGVGTKLLLAQALDRHDTIGIDVVAMCVNDVLAQGATPLFFLDYIAIGENIPYRIEQIVKGVSDGCVMANCALIGGETAEMPDMYDKDEYDIAGFTVGVVEKSKLIDGSNVKVGDKLIGLASSGLHSNGFSLVRKVILKDNKMDLNTPFENVTIGQTLLTPTKIYVRSVLKVLEKINVHGISHITGGGFDENIPRVLKQGQGIKINEDSWKILPIFQFLEEKGNIPHREMFNIFNMGIGMVLVVDEKDVKQTISILQENEEQAFVIGEVTNTLGVDIV